MSTVAGQSAAERMQRRREAWARGAAEASRMDRAHAQRQSYEQRIAEGQALIRIAEKLQAGRTTAAER